MDDEQREGFASIVRATGSSALRSPVVGSPGVGSPGLGSLESGSAGTPQFPAIAPQASGIAPGGRNGDERGLDAGRFQAERLKSVFESYLHYYASGESHTARAKRYDLQHFLDFLVERFGSADTILVSDWTMQVTKDFVDSRLSRGEAPTTVARRLATIKHLGRTLAERVHGFVNPAREVKGPVVPVARPQGLTQEETSLLREAARREVEEKERSFNALRNQFLLELLLGTGLRADEVRLLTLGQVSEDYEWLKNVKTKGRRYRNVYVSTELRPLFERYIAAREHEIRKRFSGYAQLTPAERARIPVVVSFHSASLMTPASFGVAPKTIWRIVAGFSAKAQRIAGTAVANLHPHRLRHTFAHGLLDSSRDVRLVAQALGHSDVRTTMRYTERSDDEIADAIEGRTER